ncbi:hypothetical protein BG011_009420 [Mortierella polycephala]|uniref:Methyltransferase domain-containing protein n=1 Tax=Mortierella polycephala TaxID=41804 RepID=A0A9P6U7Y0_9FUNG|nr:hypothetical protein BG011_009420 [Mortierella polycephala]
MTAHNRFLTTIRGILLKPRFLVVIVTVLTLCLIGIHHKKTLDGVYQHLPEHINRVGGKISPGLNDIQQTKLTTPEVVKEDRPRSVEDRLLYSEQVYQINLQNRARSLRQYGYGTENWSPWNAWMPWWQYFQAAFSCPHEVQRVGSHGDGGKWVCGLRLHEEHKERPCVVYSLGVSTESSFEREIADRTNCQVFAYDGSVDSMGPEATNHPSIHFHKMFIGSEDKVDEQGRTWKTVGTIMRENQHAWIDILKVDIEGYEFKVFDAFMDQFTAINNNSHETLPFSQLLVELHLQSPDMDLHDDESFPRFKTWFERLESFGLRPFWNELNLVPVLFSKFKTGFSICEFSFLNTHGDHSLLHD